MDNTTTPTEEQWRQRDEEMISRFECGEFGNWGINPVLVREVGS